MNQSDDCKRIVIAGGSGFLGVSLAQHLAGLNWKITLLSRNPPKIAGPWEHVAWTGRTLGDWTTALDGASALVNLAGRTVDCIKTPDHQDEILRSRVESTRILGEAMRRIESPPKVWVQMSTAHIYGDPPQVRCTESSSFGVGFAPTIGKAWEEAYRESLLPTQRAILLRTSFVIGRDRGCGGGAMARLTSLVRWGLGGTVGSGTQGMSWIHEDDFHRIVERALEDASMSGAYVVSAPNPVSQREFMQSLRAAMGVRIGLPAFGWMVRIGAPWLMNTDPELALYGRYIQSERLEGMGFQFRFPTLGPALTDFAENRVVDSKRATE